MRRRYNLSYFLSTGIKSFFRNGFMSFAAIVILVCAMLICGSFILLIMNIDYNIEQIDDFNEVVVFADLGATDQQIQQMYSQIQGLDNVASCTFISKEESLENERRKYGEEYSHLFDRYSENEEENPLPDTFRVEYEDVNNVDVLVYSLETIEGVSKVKNRKDIADNINKLKQVIMIVCLVLTGMLLVVSLFIIANTIRLTMKSREVEITIMRYIGATNTFITLPFIVESMVIALVATVVSFLLQCYSYSYITGSVIADYGIVETIPFTDLQWYVLGGFAAISFILCIFGTIISTRRYMRA